MPDNSVKIRIMDAICSADELSSKKSIREATGFAWNTVGRIVDRLVADRILIEKQDAPTQPGRPITHLALNPENKMLVGLSLGGSWWRFVLCDYSFNSVFEARIPTPEWSGPDNFLKFICDFLESSLQQAGHSPDQILCVGIACSGTLDPENGVLVSSLNMGVKAGIHLPLREELEKRLNTPVLVSISTVANAWGEYKFGEFAGTRDLLTVGISIGIGAGVVLDGKPLIGSPNRPVGTIGHIYIPGNERQCVCGKKGCLEAFAGGRSLLKVAAERYGDIIWQNAEDINHAAGEGDARARRILTRAAKLDAACIAFLIQIYHPQALVFTGGQCVADSFFYNSLLENLRDFLPEDIAATLKISISQIKEFGNAFGAARLAFEKFF